MKKILFAILIILLIKVSPVLAKDNETNTANVKLKGYLKEYKSPTANKVSIVSYIANLKTNEAIDALIKLLDTNKYLVKDEIIYQLGKLKARKAVPKIIKALNHDSTRIRSTALSALCEIKDKSSAKALLEYVKGSGDSSYYAAKALISMNIKEAFPIILSNITTPGSGINADLIYSLPPDADTSDIKIKVSELLKNKDSDVRIMAISMLGVLNDKTYAPNIAQLLKDADDRVREKAAYVLGDLKEKTTIKDLVNSLNDKCINVKKEALYSLALFNDESIEQSVEKIFFQDKDPIVQIAAAYTLGRVNNNASINALIKGLQIENSEVLLEIIKSLSNFNSNRQVKTSLSRLLYHKDNAIRQKAKNALAIK